MLRALAIRERILGPDHPAVASSHNNLGIVLQSEARYALAADRYREAARIYARAAGVAHPSLANALNNLGLAEVLEGDVDAGFDHLSEALRRRQESRPAEHPDIANSLVNLGLAHGARRETDRAHARLAEGYAMQVRLLGAEHPDLVETLAIHAGILCRSERAALVEEGRGLAARAVAIADKAGSTPPHPLLALALARLGRCELASGRPEAALPVLERAALARAPLDPLDAADTSLSLGWALAATGGDLERSRALVDRSRAALTGAPGARATEMSRDVDAFLATLEEPKKSMRHWHVGGRLP